MNLENVDIPPELKEEVEACETPEEVLALAKKKGYKLSDEDLAAVVGGWGVKDVLPNARAVAATKSPCLRFSDRLARQSVSAASAVTNGSKRRLDNSPDAQSRHKAVPCACSGMTPVPLNKAAQDVTFWNVDISFGTKAFSDAYNERKEP